MIEDGSSRTGKVILSEVSEAHKKIGSYRCGPNAAVHIENEQYDYMEAQEGTENANLHDDFTNNVYVDIT